MPDVLQSAGHNIPSLEDTVEKALAQAILEHPLFQVGLIHENSRKPSWVRLDRINLRNHVEWRTVSETENHEDVLREALEWQVNNRFTNLQTQPHWRSVILRPSDSDFIDVVFGWDHTAGDGMSGKFFHQSFLSSLNTVSGDKDFEPLKDRSFQVPVTPLTPPLERFLKFPISWGYLLGEGLRTLKPASMASDSSKAVKWAPQKHPCTSRLSLVTVKEDALQSVLSACRQHQTTLTGLLNALTLVSLAARIPEDKAPTFQTGTPICLRRFIPPSPEGYPGLNMEYTVANSVAYWLFTFDRDTVTKVRQLVGDIRARPEAEGDLEATVWSVATALRQELSKKLESGMKNDSLGLTKFVRDWRSFVEERTKAPRTVSFEISNLGVMNGELQKEKDRSGDGGGWTVEQAIFTQSASVAGPAITINPIAVKGKGFTMTCVWQTEVVDSGLIQGWSSDLETWLNGLGESGRLNFTRGE